MDKGADHAFAEVEEDRKGNPAVIIDGVKSRKWADNTLAEEHDGKVNPAVIIDGLGSGIMSLPGLSWGGEG